MITKEQLTVLTGSAVVDSAGAECGICKDVYVDDRTDAPAWALVTMEDGTARCAPLEDASMDGGTVHVPCTRQQLMDAPEIQGHDAIDAELESRLRRHYGVDDSAPRTSPDTPATDSAWEAEGDMATGMRDEPAGDMPGELPGGAPTEMQTRMEFDFGTNAEGADRPGATQTHLRSYNSSMG